MKFNMNNMNKKYFYLCGVVLLLIHLAVLTGYGMSKEGYHEDEYYSFFSSTGTAVVYPRSAYDVRTGHEMQRQFMVRQGERFQFAEVIQNQEEDVHPPLYYLALNVIMSLMPEHFYKWFGLALNMLCSCVTLGGIMYLLHSLGKGEACYPAVLLGGLVYAIAPSTVSNVMFIRMYAMSAMWTVLYTCVIVTVMRRGECGRRRFAVYTAAGAVLCWLAFMTHYFCLLVPFFLTFAYGVVTLWRRKGILRMLVYGLCMCGAIGLAVYCYPASIEHIFHGYRGEAALSVLLNGSFREMCAMFLPVLDKNVYAGMMWAVLAFSVAALVLLTVRRDMVGTDRAALGRGAVVYLACLASICFLVKTSLFLGDSSCRYFYPVLALLLPLQAYLWYRAVSELTAGRKRRGIIGVAAVLLACVPLLAGHMQNRVLFLYPEEAEKKELSYRYGQEYPLIMVYSKEASQRSWYMADQIWPYQYVIYSDYEHMLELPKDPLLTQAKGFVVYMDAPAETLDPLVERNPNVEGYTLLRKDNFFMVYLVE